MSLELVLGVGGIVLTLILIVLDKAGKLKGPVLIWLLVFCAAMTVPLALGNPLVLNAPVPWKMWTRALMLAVVGFVYWGIGIWISPSRETAKLELVATVNDAEYPAGTTIGGIGWSKRFTDLRISVDNPTPSDYQNVDLTLIPDEPVAAVGQVTNVPDVVFTVATELTMQQELVEAKTGKRLVNPLVLIASNGGYRVRCKALPRKTRLEIVMAITRVIDFPTQDKSESAAPDLGVFGREYVLKIDLSNGVSHWFGHGSDLNGRIEDVYKEGRVIPKAVKIDGGYTAGEQEQGVSQRVEVKDFVGDWLKQR